MRLIPAHVWDKPLSGGEAAELQVFHLLEKIWLSKFCTSMHSQNIVGGHNQTWSEIDFLIISQRAIVGIEVKGGRVGSKDGWWYVYDHRGEIKYKKNKSPLVQVSNALDHFRTAWFKDRFNNKYKNLPFVKVAILAQNNRPDANMGTELQDQLVIYKEDLLTPENFKIRLNIAIDFHIKNAHAGFAMELNQDDINEISQAVRPHLDLSYPSKARNASIENDQNNLTELQYQTADVLDNLNRYILDGGAGTGKTFLLIYDAIRKSKNGNSVGIFAPTELLKNHISYQVDQQIVCFDRSTAMEKEPFDILYVDEAQDFINQNDIEILDSLVKGGIVDGTWRFYGDLQNQISPDKTIDQTVLNFLLDCTGNNSICKMNRNVRNTPQIVNYLEKVCSVRIGETAVRGAGPDVEAVSYDEGMRLIMKKEEHRLYGNISSDELVILYPDCLENYVKQKLLRPYKNHRKLFSVSEYRGLESSVVYLIGLDLVTDFRDLRDAIYCGVSRARGLCLIGGGEVTLNNILQMRSNYVK